MLQQYQEPKLPVDRPERNHHGICVVLHIQYSEAAGGAPSEARTCRHQHCGSSSPFATPGRMQAFDSAVLQSFVSSVLVPSFRRAFEPLADLCGINAKSPQQLGSRVRTLPVEKGKQEMACLDALEPVLTGPLHCAFHDCPGAGGERQEPTRVDGPRGVRSWATSTPTAASAARSSASEAARADSRSVPRALVTGESAS